MQEPCAGGDAPGRRIDGGGIALATAARNGPFTPSAYTDCVGEPQLHPQTCPSRFIAALCALLAAAPAHAAAVAPSGRSAFASLLKDETRKAGLPFEIADAVTAIESSYDPTKIGSVGEIGLMQIRPETAAMLGFKGSVADLAQPAVNIHYGVAYLAGAWKRADGDLCRALMKYRAGHSEEQMTPLSVTYCSRARAHLASIGSAYGQGALPFADLMPSADRSLTRAQSGGARRNPLIGMSSEAFWATHNARIARINARIEQRWKRVASR